MFGAPFARKIIIVIDFKELNRIRIFESILRGNRNDRMDALLLNKIYILNKLIVWNKCETRFFCKDDLVVRTAFLQPSRCVYLYFRRDVRQKFKFCNLWKSEN